MQPQGDPPWQAHCLPYIRRLTCLAGLWVHAEGGLEQVVHLLGHLHVQPRVGVGKHNLLEAPLELVDGLLGRSPGLGVLSLLKPLQYQGKGNGAGELSEVAWLTSCTCTLALDQAPACTAGAYAACKEPARTQGKQGALAVSPAASSWHGARAAEPHLYQALNLRLEYLPPPLALSAPLHVIRAAAVCAAGPLPLNRLPQLLKLSRHIPQHCLCLGAVLKEPLLRQDMLQTEHKGQNGSGEGEELAQQRCFSVTLR